MRSLLALFLQDPAKPSKKEEKMDETSASSPTPLIVDPARVAFAGGMIVFAVGLLILAGWQFHIGFLKSMVPGTVSVKANTALCFVLLGGSIALLSHASSDRIRHFARFVAGLVAFIGGLTLLEILFGRDFGIDQLVFIDDTARIATSVPGRMADVSALSFLLLGVLLVWFGGRSAKKARWALAVIAASFYLAYWALCGYLLGAQKATGLDTHTRMALITALTFMAAELAILCLPSFRAFSHWLFSDSSFGRLLRVALPVLIVAPMVISWVLYQIVLGGWIDANTANAIDASIVSAVLLCIFWHYSFLMAEVEASSRRVAALKDKFLFFAAHELRTPLTGIKWGTELAEAELAKRGSKKAALAAIRNVQLQADGLVAFVNDLLDTSRLDYGAFKITRAQTDLLACLQEVLERVSGIAEMADVKLHLKLPRKKVFAVTDGRRVQEILLNLISNAIKYNRPGGWVEILLKEGKDEITISVHDNGVGLSVEDISKLFQRFSRIETDETKNRQGTGLGLFISKTIASLLGGDIEVESQGRGFGSTFTLKLPRNGGK